VVSTLEEAPGASATRLSAPPPTHVRGPERQAGSRGVATNALLWALRSLTLVPFVLMAPEVASGLAGRPHALAHLSLSTADVLGTSSFLLFVMMLTVTPIHVVTGWTGHLPLRRDFGVAMFAVSTFDLVLAATTTGDTFHGGLLARVGGHTFLVVGTLSVVLLVPLALTANRRAQRWLGGYWKRLHRLVYVIWALILLHLLLLFGVSGVFVSAFVLSIPLAVLRIPSVRRWWSAARQTHEHRLVRCLLALVLCATFVVGVRPIVKDLITSGQGAFTEHPVDD